MQRRCNREISLGNVRMHLRNGRRRLKKKERENRNVHRNKNPGCY
jgi:hypothetical protein